MFVIVGLDVPLCTRLGLFCSMVLILLMAGICSGCTIYLYTDSGKTAYRESENTADSRVMMARDGLKLNAEYILDMSVADRNPALRPIHETPWVLSVRTAVEAYVHCYFQTVDGSIYRVNTESVFSDSLLKAGQSMSVPISLARIAGTVTREDVSSCLCLAAADNLMEKLAVTDIGTYTKIPQYISFDQIYSEYRRATTGNLIGRTVNLTLSR